MSVKECRRCGVMKPLTEFYRSARHRGGYRHECRSCWKKADQVRKGRTPHGESLTAGGVRECTKCGQVRPIEQFAGETRSRAGRRRQCLRCERDARVQRLYGITLEDYEGMAWIQDGVCACCGMPERAIDPRTGQPRELAVDHCHETGKVRGLLCSFCNTAIGKLGDSLSGVLRAARYLEGVSL